MVILILLNFLSLKSMMDPSFKLWLDLIWMAWVSSVWYWPWVNLSLGLSFAPRSGFDMGTSPIKWKWMGYLPCLSGLKVAFVDRCISMLSAPLDVWFGINDLALRVDTSRLWAGTTLLAGMAGLLNILPYRRLLSGPPHELAYLTVLAIGENVFRCDKVTIEIYQALDNISRLSRSELIVQRIGWFSWSLVCGGTVRVASIWSLLVIGYVHRSDLLELKVIIFIWIWDLCLKALLIWKCHHSFCRAFVPDTTGTMLWRGWGLR